MRYIYITSRVTGRAWIYEKIRRQGHKRLVPCYAAEMGDDALPRDMVHHFAVTRDSARVVFHQESSRYGIGGECPPPRVASPYRGRLFPAPRNGLSMLLYEPGLTGSTLVGSGTVVRQSILIHRGPGSSLGCMTIAGGARAYKAWVAVALRIANGEEDNFHVFIDPRPQAHHDIHLSR